MTLNDLEWYFTLGYVLRRCVYTSEAWLSELGSLGYS